MPLAGIEPAFSAPEADALSIKLQRHFKAKRKNKVLYVAEEVRFELT